MRTRTATATTNGRAGRRESPRAGHRKNVKENERMRDGRVAAKPEEEEEEGGKFGESSGHATIRRESPSLRPDMPPAPLSFLVVGTKRCHSPLTYPNPTRKRRKPRPTFLFSLPPIVRSFLLSDTPYFSMSSRLSLRLHSRFTFLYEHVIFSYPLSLVNPFLSLYFAVSDVPLVLPLRYSRRDDDVAAVTVGGINRSLRGDMYRWLGFSVPSLCVLPPPPSAICSSASHEKRDT